jgi:predicted transcriptional regulator
MSEAGSEFIQATANIVSAYVSKNHVGVRDVPDLILSVHAALASLSNHSNGSTPEETLVPAVSIKKSITHDFLICLEDGLMFKSLKRHLNSKYGLTADQYRAKWGLPADYPMVAPAYAERRSAMAKSFGFGRKPSAPGGTAAAHTPKGKRKPKPKSAI